MRCYRVAWISPGWERRGQRTQGHPLYVAAARQGAGRFDNPRHYAALYCSMQPEGAIGEIIGNHAAVRDDQFVWRERPELRRHLVALDVDTPVMLDLDDAEVLVRLGLRPSDVVRRHREVTRKLALRRFLDRDRTGESGLAWWSYHHPDWRQLMFWSSGHDVWFPDLRVIDATPLDRRHPDVVVAAELLRRAIV